MATATFSANLFGLYYIVSIKIDIFCDHSEISLNQCCMTCYIALLHSFSDTLFNFLCVIIVHFTNKDRFLIAEYIYSRFEKQCTTLPHKKLQFSHQNWNKMSWLPKNASTTVKKPYWYILTIVVI